MILAFRGNVMRFNWVVMAMLVVITMAVATYAEEKKLIRTEKISDKITRLIYSDGSEEWDIPARGESMRIMRFIPSPPQTNPEPTPTPKDTNRGYIIFSPKGREGVLPEYRPVVSDITDAVSIFASRGEFEPVTLAIRPLKDLGTITFSCGNFTGPGNAAISNENIDIYVVEPTAEQIGGEHLANQVRWLAKWLRPGNTAKTVVGENVQVYLDVYVSDNVKAGPYRGVVAIKPEKGMESSFTINLEVLPLKLERPMPWGFFNYDWAEVDKRGDEILWTLKEMKRTGMTQCVISPINYQNRPPVREDGSIDLSIYDQCIRLYEKSGFKDPPILAMEGLMHNIVHAMGKAQDLKFTDLYTPGVKVEEIPADVREFAWRVIRRIYEHAIETKWPKGFYLYFADEPGLDSYRMENAKFMYGAVRKVAPDMRTACTAYTLEDWKELDKLLDLNIINYQNMCRKDALLDLNDKYLAFAKAQNAKMYGFDWFPSQRGDTFWDIRKMTLTVEKGGMDGIICWTQWPYLPMKGPGAPQWMEGSFNPYMFLPCTFKGGPWFMTDTQEDKNPVWRSLPWLGIREGIDDSRYLRTLRKYIEDATTAGKNDAANKAIIQLKKVMDEVAWAPGPEEYLTWTAVRADVARRSIADEILNIRKALGLMDK